MARHNLDALTPFDFEALSKSLLDRELGMRFEIYKPGRDGGVDLRFALSGSGNVIVQCKHWPNASAAKLITALVKDELSKIKRLAPTRYLVTTSASITTLDAQKIVEGLAPYVLGTADVYGLERIERFLEDNEDVVRKHLRLWLSSSAVLQQVLTKAITLRSIAYTEQIKNSLPTFVQTKALSRAQATLQSKRVLLISGPPGIGKTTLANILCAELMADGAELVKISGDVSDGLDAWAGEASQVFLYDDFLGRSAGGDHLGKNEDQEILDFAERVAASPNKYFIMTTRGYILNQARRVYEKLSSPTLKYSECLIELADLDEQARSLILYNLVWASGLPNAQRSRFAKLSVYRPILAHRNYSPRLIELSLKRAIADDFVGNADELMIRNLQSPQDLWHHAIANDLDSDARLLLDLMVTLGAAVRPSSLRQLWGEFVLDGASADRYDRALETLEGDFLMVSGEARDPVLSTANPSIDDYMTARLNGHDAFLIETAAKTLSFNNIRGIRSLVDPARRKALKMKVQDDPSNAVGHALLDAGLRLERVPETFERLVDDEIADRLAFLVALAVPLGRSAEVSAKVEAFMTEVQSHYFDRAQSMDPRALVELAVVTVEKGEGGGLSVVDDLLEYLDERLMQTDNAWDEISESMDLAEMARKLLPNAHSHLEAMQRDRAQEIIADWARDLDGWELRSALEYASNLGAAEAIFPGYLEANMALDDIEQRRSDEDRDWYKDEGSDVFDVNRLMSGLAD